MHIRGNQMDGIEMEHGGYMGSPIIDIMGIKVI